MLCERKIYNLLSVLCVSIGLTQTVSADQTPNLGEKMYPVEMYWAKQDMQEIAKKTLIAGELVAGHELHAKKLVTLLRESKDLGRWISPFDDASGLKVKVIPEYNEIRVINRELSEVFDGEDVGKETAVEIAIKYLDSLQETGMLDHHNYNMDDIQIGFGKFGEGSTDGSSKVEHIYEYRVTFRPNVRGIQLANAGVRIAVHRSGKLASIRMGGVSIRESHSRGKVIRKVSKEKIDSRFNSMIPKNNKPSIAWSRVMYVMPENKREALVEPMQVYAYSLISEIDGEPVVSRGKIVGFSLTDANTRVVDFTAPTSVQKDPNQKLRKE